MKITYELLCAKLLRSKMLASGVTSYTRETPLREFKPWGDAKVSFSLLTETELDLVEDYLKNMYPHGISEIGVNDFFIYNISTIEEIIGHSLEKE